MVAFRAFRYRLATLPYRIYGKTHQMREGILLRSCADPSLWSDVAPLTGYSTDTLEQVVDAIRQNSDADLPSLQFGVQSLSSESPNRGSIPVSALIDGTVDEIATAALRISRTRIQSVKLKVGQQSIETDIERVRTLRRTLVPRQTIRLDANRAWELRTAIAFIRALADTGIEYIEEPLAHPRDLESLFAETHIPYALDETLRDHDFHPSDYPNAAAFVVKPTCLGGERSIERLAQLGKPIVFSSAFETGVGVFQIARLAARFSPGIPAGLDTYRWLIDDILCNRWRMDDGYFHFDGLTDIDVNKLEEIPL